MTIKKSEIHEETIWVFMCPRCSEFIKLREDPCFEDRCTCPECGARIALEDD